MKLRRVCKEAIELIKRHELFIDHVYICPGGKPTIGYGHVLATPQELEKYRGKIITEDEAEELLRKDLIIARIAVQKYINVTLSDLQFGALVSWTFNLGAGALQRSTMRSVLNRGEYDLVEDEMERWVYAGGRKLKGLVIRMAEEAEMFNAGTGEEINGDEA